MVADLFVRGRVFSWIVTWPKVKSDPRIHTKLHESNFAGHHDCVSELRWSKALPVFA